jgi:hypothetical protein
MLAALTQATMQNLQAQNALAQYMQRPREDRGSSSKEPSFEPSKKFTGQNRNYAISFMISIKQGIDCAPRRYDSGMSKIAFLATHLEGNARDWYDGVFGLPAEQRPEWLRNWDFEIFSTEFLRVWGPYDPIEQATTRMFSNGFLQGETQKISEFLTEFETLANRIPQFIGDIATFNGTFAASILWGKMSPRSQDLAEPVAGLRPKTYHALVQYLREMEKSEEAKVTNRRLRAGNSRASSSTITSSEATSKAKTKGKSKAREVGKSKFRTKRAPNSGDRKDLTNIIGGDGKLLPAEIERRIKYNLCSYCGEKDHKRDECPNAAKKPNVSGRFGDADEDETASVVEEVVSDSSTESGN